MPGTPPTPRTNATLVEGLVDVQAGFDLSPFIAFANQIVTDVCTYGVVDNLTPYTDGFVGSKMELIERWLAAHAYTVFDNQLTHARAGTVSVGYQQKVDMGFKSSIYGQNAMRLDTNGGLARLDNSTQTKRKINIGVIWAGTVHRALGTVPTAGVQSNVANYADPERIDRSCADADLTTEQ